MHGVQNKAKSIFYNIPITERWVRSMRTREKLGDRNVVGENIFQIRFSKHLSQGDLLRRIQLLGTDMNQAKLFRIEGQRIAVTDRDLIVIAQALDVSLDELCKQKE